MWAHNIQWQAGAASGVMPMPTLVTATYKHHENVMKAGSRIYRKRKGVWAGCKIHYDSLEPADFAALDALLRAESADDPPFELSVDGGATFRVAFLAKEIDPKPIFEKNVALDITLEFDYRDRLAAYPSPIHQGI